MGLVGVCVCFALAACASRWRALVFVFAALGFLAPLLTENALARCLFSIGAFACLLRTIDLVRMKQEWPAWRRIAHVLSPIDTRRLIHRRPPLRLPLTGLVWAFVTALSFVGVLLAPKAPMPMVTRWIAGAVFAYAVTEFAYPVLALLYAIAGFKTPELHRLPIASRTVQEFWGIRWNRTVGSWLRDNCFLPLVRRGHPRLGLMWAFLFSGLGHAYIGYMGIKQLWAALAMLVFFLAQGVFILIETALAARSWRRSVGHAWVILTIGGTSPLFLEPLLRVVF